MRGPRARPASWRGTALEAKACSVRTAGTTLSERPGVPGAPGAEDTWLAGAAVITWPAAEPGGEPSMVTNQKQLASWGDSPPGVEGAGPSNTSPPSRWSAPGSAPAGGAARTIRGRLGMEQQQQGPLNASAFSKSCLDAAACTSAPLQLQPCYHQHPMLPSCAPAWQPASGSASEGTQLGMPMAWLGCSWSEEPGRSVMVTCIVREGAWQSEKM